MFKVLISLKLVK